MANYNFQIFKQIFFTDKICIYDTYSFVLNCSRRFYCIFSKFSPQNDFIMTPPPPPPFYENVKLGPNPTFYYQPPHPPLPILGFLISQEHKTELFLRTKSKNKY